MCVCVCACVFVCVRVCVCLCVCVYKYNYIIKSVDAKDRYIKGKRKISLLLLSSLAWLLLGIF